MTEIDPLYLIPGKKYMIKYLPHENDPTYDGIFRATFLRRLSMTNQNELREYINPVILNAVREDYNRYSLSHRLILERQTRKTFHDYLMEFIVAKCGNSALMFDEDDIEYENSGFDLTDISVCFDGTVIDEKYLHNYSFYELPTFKNACGGDI